MRITCPACSARFDDEFLTTICPHETLAANDGRNNFAHHPESGLVAPGIRHPLDGMYHSDRCVSGIGNAATEYADQHCPKMLEIPGLTQQAKKGIMTGIWELLREAYIAGQEKGNAV